MKHNKYDKFLLRGMELGLSEDLLSRIAYEFNRIKEKKRVVE